MEKTSLICNKCSNPKYKGYKDQIFCPFCKNQKRRIRYSQNPEKHRAQMKQRRLNNLEYFRERDAKTRLLNREKIIEQKRERYRKNPAKFAAERERRHPLYTTWCGMKDRCYNKNKSNYERYGGRGISVCDRWRYSFESFLIDMGSKPSPLHTLDRYPNSQGNYEPGNVRWATKKEQQNNTRRTNKYRSSVPENSPIYYPENTLITIKEFSHQIDMPFIVVKYRYARHSQAWWILDQNEDNRRYVYGKHRYTMSELSLITGVSFSVMRSRIHNRNWSVSKAVETPLKVV